jgi:hypothetical protein
VNVGLSLVAVNLHDPATQGVALRRKLAGNPALNLLHCMSPEVGNAGVATFAYWVRKALHSGSSHVFDG